MQGVIAPRYAQPCVSPERKLSGLIPSELTRINVERSCAADTASESIGLWLMRDDLPPEREDTSFAAELGHTVGGFAFISFFFAIAGLIAWFILKG